MVMKINQIIPAQTLEFDAGGYAKNQTHTTIDLGKYIW